MELKSSFFQNFKGPVQLSFSGQAAGKLDTPPILSCLLAEVHFVIFIAQFHTDSRSPVVALGIQYSYNLNSPFFRSVKSPSILTMSSIPFPYSFETPL